MRQLVALVRLLRVVLHLIRGLLTVWIVFPGLSLAQREQRVQQWARAMLVRVGVDLLVVGEVPQAGPALLVANHISWLDILVMHAARPCRFISKSDVRHWPLIGTLASAAGTLYIERASRRDAMRVVHAMASCLEHEQLLAVFPEGTTGDGKDVLPFHGNLLQAAISTHAPAIPVALRFVDSVSQQITVLPCYIGEESLVESLWRTLGAQGLQAQVHYGAAQRDAGRDRRQWAAELRDAIITMRG